MDHLYYIDTSLSPENDKEIENKGADIQLTIG